MDSKKNKVASKCQQMAAGTCKLCKLPADKKNAFICSDCKLYYHFDCAGVSEKLFMIMDVAKKDRFKCKLCTNKQNTISKPTARKSLSTPKPFTSQRRKLSVIENLDDQNVTKRPVKINVHTSNSFQSLHSTDEDDEDDEIENMDEINRSCSNIKFNKNEHIKKLTNRINELEFKLMNSDKLVDNLLEDINNLTKKNNEYLQKIELLTIICKSTTKKPKQKKKQKTNSTRLDFTPSEIEDPDHRSSRCVQSPTEDHNSTKVDSSQGRENEIGIDGNMSQKRCDEPDQIENSFLVEDCVKPKLNIISSNKDNKILDIVYSKLFEKFSICHFLTPHCNNRYLLENIDDKLNNFTQEDFCVIFLSDEDFKNVNDNNEYFKLIEYIRLKLLKINFTNVIICVPSYKCGTHYDNFNWNVELFINLLHLDNMTHKYSYMLDTNLNVTYDFTTFNKFNGKLNNRGMNIVIEDLKHLINEIQSQSNIDESSIATDNSNIIQGKTNKMNYNDVSVATKDINMSRHFFRSKSI